jgi:hypothetical protein
MLSEEDLGARRDTTDRAPATVAAAGPRAWGLEAVAGSVEEAVVAAVVVAAGADST